MNLREFELHRPLLGRQLREMLESDQLDDEWQVYPRYTDGIRFVAEMSGIILLICVSPEHPMSMVDEAAPGCQGTWWWEEDLLTAATAPKL